MKLYSSGSLVMAIFAGAMGAFLTWSFMVGGNLGEALTAGLCWYAFAQGLYIAFVPGAKERDEQAVINKRKILYERFGGFSSLVAYVSLLVFFAGVVIAMLVSVNVVVRGVIIVLSLGIAGYVEYKMQKWLLEEMKKLSAETEEAT